MDIEQKLDRCEELERTIDLLNTVFNFAESEDIKSDITDLVLKYETELQDLNNELTKKAEDEKKYLNNEYIKSCYLK